MNPDFAIRLDQRLTEYRAWAANRQLSSCRLVHYAGMGEPSSVDLPAADAEEQISRCLIEGYLVDWNDLSNKLYIAVQEPGCPMPPWDKVFAEEELVDVEALLREAGFRDGA